MRDAARLTQLALRLSWRGAGPVGLATATVPILAAPLLFLLLAPFSPFAALLLSTAAGAALCRPGLRRLARDHGSGWAASLPLTRNARWVAARAPIALLALAAGLILATSTVLWSTGTLELALAAGGGIVGGALLALLWPVAGAAQSYPDSRYRLSAPRTDGRSGASPVVVDFHATVAARMQPRALARIVAPVLLVLPSGMAPTGTVAVLLAGAGAIYLHFLFDSLAPFSAATRRWLVSTPADLRALGRCVHRSLRFRLVAILLASGPLLVSAFGAVRGAVLAAGLLTALDVLAWWRLRRTLAAR